MRRRALRAAAGAAALLSALSTGGFFCNALVVRSSAVPKGGDIRRVRGGVAGLRATWIDEQVSVKREVERGRGR